MGETSIEWTDRTWNPVRGCSRVSPGCERCYAERIAGRFSGKGQKFEGFARGLSRDYHGQSGAARTNGTWRWTGRVELVQEKLDEPLRWRKPQKVFVNSMSDLFHEELGDEAMAAVFGVMAAAPQHTFQVLTKRPERMRDWMAWIAVRPSGLLSIPYAPKLVCAGHAQALTDRHWTVPNAAEWPLPNVWLGVSVEDQATADQRIPLLLQTPAAVRFVSYEPALGPAYFGSVWSAERGVHFDALRGSSEHRVKVDWIIVGGESGPGARPFDIAWARDVVEQCKAAGTACFVKQLGARPMLNGRVIESPRALIRDRKGGDPAEWPIDLRVREFPVAVKERPEA